MPIFHPEVVTDPEMSSLTDTAWAWMRIEQAWNSHCNAEQEPRVWRIPLAWAETGIAQQVSRTDVEVVLDVIEPALGGG